jgi:hypothetical protein
MRDVHDGDPTPDRPRCGSRSGPCPRQATAGPGPPQRPQPPPGPRCVPSQPALGAHQWPHRPVAPLGPPQLTDHERSLTTHGPTEVIIASPTAIVRPARRRHGSAPTRRATSRQGGVEGEGGETPGGELDPLIEALPGAPGEVAHPTRAARDLDGGELVGGVEHPHLGARTAVQHRRDLTAPHIEDLMARGQVAAATGAGDQEGYERVLDQGVGVGIGLARRGDLHHPTQLVATLHLGAEGLDLGAGRQWAVGHGSARQPPGAAQEGDREGVRPAAGEVDQLVLQQPLVGDGETAGAHEAARWEGGQGVLGLAALGVEPPGDDAEGALGLGVGGGRGERQVDPQAVVAGGLSSAVVTRTKRSPACSSRVVVTSVGPAADALAVDDRSGQV